MRLTTPSSLSASRPAPGRVHAGQVHAGRAWLTTAADAGAVDVALASRGVVLAPDNHGPAPERTQQVDEVARLTKRQRQVLSLLARGLSNAAIARIMVITERSVVEHVSNVYALLELPATGEEHRRVLAALSYLRHCARRRVLRDAAGVADAS